MSGLRAKVREWERQVDWYERAMVEEYGRMAVEDAVKATPPGNARVAPGSAVAYLKGRIAQDFGMDRRAKEFTEEDVGWITVNGYRKAYIRGQNRQPGPFLPFKGKATPVVLRSLHNVGRYGVRFVDGDVGAFMRDNFMDYKYRVVGSSVRLRWWGVRHVARATAIKNEVRKRQHNVGRLMSGWKPAAQKVKAKLPKAAQAQNGRGAAEIKRHEKAKYVLVSVNKEQYMGDLQRIIDQQLRRRTRKRLWAAHKKRTRALAKKLNK